ncbi:hypothetical protein JTB14_029440 [Gonioctena quinquepunctata]|nr:hypothetical protein JTB14_029440 [Gonioctena quinquepunctata]
MHMLIKMRPPHLAPIRNFGPQKMPYKKHVRAPARLQVSNSRPYYFSINSPQRPNIFVSQASPIITRAPPIQTQMIRVTESGRGGDIKNVEISPQQPSTEKEPEIQTAPSTSAIDISPLMLMRPAHNTGFKPDSIKIEGGFKPIITKEFPGEDRQG